MLQNQAKMWQEQKRIAEQQEAQRKKQEEEYLKQLAQSNPGTILLTFQCMGLGNNILWPIA